MRIKYVVITKIPDPFKGEYGNLYHATLDSESGDIFVENAAQTKTRPMLYKDMAQFTKGSLMLENFFIGELLVINGASEREIGGKLRKPGNWNGVEFEVFKSVRKAVKRAQEITDAKR